MMKANRDVRQRGNSSVTIHGILAGVALIAAYTTWTRDKTQVQDNTVAALSAKKSDIQSVVYEDENRTVTVERRTDRSDPYSWVTVKTRQKTLVTPPPPPPAPAPAAPATAPAAPTGKPPGAPQGAAKPEAAKPADGPKGTKGGDKAAADKAGEKGPPGAAPAAAPAADPHGHGAPAAPAGAADPHGHGAPAAASAAAPPPAAGTAPAVPPTHQYKETITEKPFRGSESADKLLDSFAPLMALRQLGSVDDAKAKDLGLSDSKKSLTVTVKGQQMKWTLGSTSYGAGDLYARSPEGVVFLLPARFQTDFEYAESRLMERRLHRFDRQEIARVEVEIKGSGKKKTFVQGNAQDLSNFYWADGATPDKKDETAKNWIDKVLRIAISDYVAKGEEPQAPQASSQPAQSGLVPATGEVMVVRFFDKKKEIGSATFSRYPKGTTTEYYATTETTVGLVRLLAQTAESAVQDAEKW